MRMNLLKTFFVAASILFIAFAVITSVRAQETSSQKALASRTAKFETVSKTDELYTGAIDAHDLGTAHKLIGKDGALKGTVAKIFTTRDGGILILNFDRDYKTALTAVLRKSDFAKFPDMSQLDGKEIVVSGKFVDFRGAAEIALTDPKQISIVK